MKKLTLLAMILAVCGTLFCQQEPQNTLYMLNPFLTNPALAGTNNYYQIRTNHRFQWTGLKDAPITNSISAYGPHSTKSMGYGGTIYNDITGPTSRTGINGVYAYNIAATPDIRVSMGLSVGVMQYKVDGTKIVLHDDGAGVEDPALQKILYSKMVPDASVGVYVWNSDFFAGFSALQLLNNKIKLSSNDPEPELNRLSRHFYLFGGYHYEPSKDLALEPSLIVKKVVPASYQLEFNAKVIYKRMLWGGLSFRTGDAISLIIGYSYDKYFIGCAYDYAVSSIRQYTTGSFEFCLGVNFSSLKKASGRKKK